VSEEARIDLWLWSVRLYKTRSLAADACRGGHVRVNGTSAKPSTPVRVGHRVEATAGGRERTLEVARIITKRVGAPAAAECVIDHTPPPPSPELVGPALNRDPGTGRPTKRDRRNLDRMRNR
jgi:ribosome-associated heat shock protein Hsp15